MITYKIVQIPSARNIARGSDFEGLTVSSAEEEIASKPIKAKKTLEAAAKTPEVPNGINGV